MLNQADEQNIDSLTGLPLRRTFSAMVDRLMEREPGDYCMLTTSIEHFRYYTKWHGRTESEKLIKAIADFLHDCEDEYGILAGYMGADVFCAFFSANNRLADRIRSGFIKVLNEFKDNEIFRPIFGGFIQKKGGDSTAIDMYDYTLNAIEQAVGSMKTNIFWFDDAMAKQLIKEMELMPQVTYGLEHAQFTFFLQPKCQIRSGRIVGAEALMRWITETGEVIAPDEFIPTLEKNGYIIQLDRHIWEMACQVLRRWMDQGKKLLPISVNISRIDIQELDVASIFQTLLTEYRIPVEYLELEITESAYVEDEAIIKETETALRKMGFKILIDDFGSGYSSLNMLKDIEADVLKLDIRFLDMNDKNFDKGKNIVSSVISMANQINLPVIAEGVETLEQSEMLAMLGCDLAQGYYYYRPMPIAEYELLIEDTKNIATSYIEKRRSGSSYLRDLAQYFWKVAEVNPFTGEYNFIHREDNFKFIYGSKPDTITEYINQCIENGHIHPDDIPGYLQKTDLVNVQHQLLRRSLRLRHDLRYNFDGEYSWFTFECLQPKNFSLEQPWVLFTWRRAYNNIAARMDTLSMTYKAFRHIMKVNLRNGRYEFIKKDMDQPPQVTANSDNAVEWAKNYCRFMVHPDDREGFLRFWEYRNLIQHFRRYADTLRHQFRYRLGEQYVWCSVEVSRSIEYSALRPILMISVRDVPLIML